jgi:P27 family predicted phage terminase small subunit
MARLHKPTALKELSGNPGKRPLNKAEPRPLGEPTRPTALTPNAKKIWAKLVVSMPEGVFTSADNYLLAAYCEAVATHQLATVHLSTGEYETEGSTGQKKLSPWFALQSDSARLIVTIGAKLGLDPTSRQNINTGPKEQAENEFSGLIN